MKLKFLLLFFVFMFSFAALADPWKNLHQGDQAAQEFLNKLDQKKKEAGAHPFYNGKNPKEANLSKSDLKGKSHTVAQSNSGSQMIKESVNTRPKIKIDPEKDSLLTGSQEILENPLKKIGGNETKSVEVSQNEKDEILECEEGGDDSLESCISDLKVTVIKIKVKKEKQDSARLTGCKKSHKDYHIRSCPTLLSNLLEWRRYGFWKRHGGSIDVTSAYKQCLQEVLDKTNTRCYRCNNPRTTVSINLKKDQMKKVIIERDSSGHPLIQGGVNFSKHGRVKTYNLQATIKIFYEEDGYEVKPDEWISNCDHLEEKVDQGLCSYASEVCTQGKETRHINGIPITRSCWQKKLTYSCDHPAKNDCGPLRVRGCAQINSTCKKTIGNTCVMYTQTYQCKGKTRTNHQIIGGKTPFCLDGNCRDQSYELNDEIMSSIAQLSLLKAMKGKMNSIFTGKEHQCSKHILNFKDCCGSGKGWGKTVGLGSCKSEEKELHEKRKSGLCHYVGTYCAKKVLGKCTKKKSSYCCFGTKLLKAFHEQGRPQINMGWGESKHPLCRGFTIEEIQRIDFSKMDLREAFEDLLKSYTPGKMKNMKLTAGEKIEKTDLNHVREEVIDKSRSTQIQDAGKRVGERVEILKKGMGPNGK